MGIKFDFTRYSPIEIYQMRLDGSIKKFPDGFWDINNAIIVTKYLFEELLKWDKEDIKKKYDIRILQKYKLDGMMRTLFNGSTYYLIQKIYPNVFKPWELKVTPQGYWKDHNNIKIAIKWLIEEKLKWNKDQIIKNLNNEVFIENGLASVVPQKFRNAYRVLTFVYPNEDWSDVKKRIDVYNKSNW